MTKLEGRRSRLQGAKTSEDLPAVSKTTADQTPSEGGEAIPDHVWQVLQQAGDKAAQRLLELLEAASFSKLAPTAQARVIELALTRAYGLPVRRSVNVDLSSSDADAVAASLAALTDALPERQRSAHSASKHGPVIDLPAKGQTH